jgi:hypothetical protein
MPLIFMGVKTMLEFNSRKLEIKFDGTIHTLSFPTVKQMNEYNDSFETEKNKVKLICDFIARLGLPEDVCEKLEMHHLEAILKELTEVKK